MKMQQAINAVVERQDLSNADMTAVMRAIMTGAATDAQIGGFLVGLRMKGETVAEITAAASVMRALATRVEIDDDNLVDPVGTGGDASGLFNVSTASAFVAAAAGAKVAKHGNRSITSKSGSADVLEAAGVVLGLAPEQVVECVRKVGVGFMFAPAHHAAMKHAIGPRKEMAVRTIFNLLGPLTNPAGTRNQVLGVYAAEWLEPLAEVLRELGSRHVMVVHSEDGLDELSIAAPTNIAELKDGDIHRYQVDPAALGIVPGTLDALKARDAAHSLELIRSAFDGQPGPVTEMIALNAGAVIYVAGKADSLESGIKRARKLLEAGAASDKLQALVALTQQMQAQAA